ncbi:hypothetical protein GQ43DRAFT_482877 [Delitschia confertaspora ATCC 74209]|uniref:DNA polymerase n=1 Tax=Delitschia confertaspora ATCC 74209 TaxID=1513339 RepID=A0A9P4JM29_9PLEO|nr:hypothetical protein GQ43DRAFT_482877 [Delitschia confertaspora ATCC 74209]
MDTFRFRLNCIDHYQGSPTDLDPILRRGPAPSQRQNGPPVPVIRVFGATEAGQKVCAHIHGALPYLYLEYDGSLEKNAVDTYIQTLRASIDHALTISYRRNAYDGKSIFVGHITLVKGVPFYGYHVGYRFFLKVYLLNPLYMTRFADLLYQGEIMNRVFQPYESHLQYLLQWMCDYNLYGCGYIECAKVQFRGPVPEFNPAYKWHERSISKACITDSDQFPRLSHCAIEIDVCVQDILNRKEVTPRPIHHDFRERFTDSDPNEKFVPSMAALWRDETFRRKRQMGLTDPSSSPFPSDVLVSMSAESRKGEKGGWMHEEDYRELVNGLIREGQQNLGNRSPAEFDTFVKPVDGEYEVNTAVESIEDLYPENLSLRNLDDELGIEAHAMSGLDSENLQSGSPNAVGLGVYRYEHEEEQDIPQEMEIDAQEREEEETDGVDYAALDPLSVSEALLESFGTTHTSDNEERGVSSPDGKIRVDSENHISAKRRLEDPEQALSKRHCPLEPRKADLTPGTRRLAFQDEQPDEDVKGSISASQKSHHNGPPPFSQVSIKAHGISGPTTLAFPVVKNATAPETVLRLSQSGFSNSQELPKTSGSKGLKDLSLLSLKTPWSHQKTSPITSSYNSPKPHAETISLISQMEKSFDHSASRTLYYAELPPPSDFIGDSMMEVGLPLVLYQDAYYSDDTDVPDRPREYAGREFRLESSSVPYLPPFDPTGSSPANFGEKPPVVLDKTKENALALIRKHRCGLRHWEIAAAPPSAKEVEDWLVSEANETAKTKSGANKQHILDSQREEISQIDGPTQKNKHGFKYSQNQKATSVKHEVHYMSILSLEVHINSRGTLFPDPAEDEISCIFWCIQGEGEGNSDRGRVGIMCLSENDGIAKRIAKQTSVTVEYEEDELELINRIVDLVREFDPDILTGYEVHNGSWGYLIERARLQYEYNLCDEISRMKSQSLGRLGKDSDRWGFTHTSTIRITGRHMINIWRAMRGELNLLQYTIENVVFHLLHKRIPHYTHQDLTTWYTQGKPHDLAKVLDYFLSRVQLNLDILEANEIIPRTSEQARLLGVDFFSVISRGSQFKVESTMFRIAKPENFILVSPSRKQVGQQNALECLPLVMEPQSDFYTSPLLVLDFQSLYPSVMIAYNYCYSTCLGRVVSWRGRNKMGFMDFKRDPELLRLVKDHINIAPNGMMYVNPEMRKSLLAKMLGEILETRVMVKSGMKQDKDDKTLQQLLNNRQLALKLLANVTYGYTSASFSGRMPCSEIADSIVQTGRETLEKAIALIHSVERWGAEVVYGDTDSLFVYLKGRTRDQAFTIGEEIAEAVTQANPRPVKLKFEKVYHPCVLLAKKRYVGFKYEHRSQKEPEFDAKGIETVRRDGTPAEQKIEEKALKILFRTSDLSQVKSYFQSQCTKIMSGRISIQDFLFAKEVKLGTYSDRGPPPPGALIATKRMLADHRAEPQYGERIPYVVITGAPGARLIDRCVSPETLLQNDHVELDAEYYISKNIIPPLERIFNLVGANVRQWYDEMPKVHRIRNISIPVSKPDSGPTAAGLKKTLESYMKSSTCLLCRSKLPRPSALLSGAELDAYALLPLCGNCLKRPARALLALRERLCKAEKRAKEVEMVCRSCTSLAWGDGVKCDNHDCPVFYSRVREKAKLAATKEGVGRVVEVLERRELDW